MLTVLVADDDARIRRLLRLTLDGTHEVIEAADGAEALRMLFQERPDVLLLDVGMPIIDGLAVCRAVRAEPEFDRLGIVIISASAGADEALEAGADLHLPKPFRPLELLSAIEKVAARHPRAASDRRLTQPSRLVDAG